MRVEFGWIIRALEISNPFAENLKGRVLALCTSPGKALQLLVELSHDESEDDCKSNRSFYALFKSCAFDEGKNKLSAFEEALKALKGFGDCGEEFNEALTYWYVGLLYKNYKEYHLAIPELNEAVRILKRIAKIYEGESNYRKKKFCEKCIPKISRMIESIKIKQYIGPQMPQVAVGNALWKSALLNFSGSVTGVYVFNNQSYNIYESSRGNIIEIGPWGDFYWVLARDNSMDRAKPIPVEPTDFLLVDRKLQPRQNDIVLAVQKKPIKQGNKVHFLFRYTSSGLVTESSFTTLQVPLDCADTILVVVAVGKI
jgi:hypothetical protein